MPISLALVLATLTGVAGFALGLIYHDEVMGMIQDGLDKKSGEDS